MLRVLLLAILLVVPESVRSQGANSCPACARALELTGNQWRCLQSQLHYALARRHDPERFDVDGCGRRRRPLSPPICPGCAPPRPLTLLLSLAHQRCVSAILAREIPDRPVNLEIECGPAQHRRA
jgi:hypothetical protein